MALGPNADALNAACGASFDRSERDLRNRVAGPDAAIYYDQADPRWRGVRVLSHEVRRAVRSATLIDGVTGRYLSGNG